MEARILGPSEALVGVQVELDGSGSTGDGPLTYRWTQIGGPGVDVEGEGTDRIRLLAPDTATELSFTLEVSTGSATDMAVHVVAVRPSGGATRPEGWLPDFTVQVGEDGLVTVAPTLAGPTYDWTFGDATSGVASNTLVAHQYRTSGTYTITMTLDGKTRSSPVDVVVPTGGASTGDESGPLGFASAAGLALVILLAIAAFVLVIKRRRASQDDGPEALGHQAVDG